VELRSTQIPGPLTFNGEKIMKRVIFMFVIGFFVAGPMMAPKAEAADAGAATVMSLILPGVGEWYNNDWRGSYPWGECIVGSICVLFKYSSVMDAANGNADSGIRLDFWSAPQN
jgi:hypothetical protein